MDYFVTLFSFWGFCFGSTVKVLDHLQFFGWHEGEDSFTCVGL